MNFPFELLSDADEQACTLFGVMKMKNMYGKQVRGVERSTFVIDAAGRSLGLDAWLRRNVPAVRDGAGFVGKLLKIAS